MRKLLLVLALLAFAPSSRADVYTFSGLSIALGYQGPVVLTVTWASGASRDMTTATGQIVLYKYVSGSTYHANPLLTKSLSPIGGNQISFTVLSTDTLPAPGSYYSEITLVQGGVTDVLHGTVKIEGLQ
jgi:hypothetical protein